MFPLTHNCSKFIKICELLNNNIRYMSCKNDFIFKQKTVSINCLNRFSTSSSNTDTVDVKEVNFDAITKGDKDLEHKLKVIQLEAVVMRQEGKCVPEDSFLSENHWRELLNLASRSARKKYLEFLFKTSKKQENRLEKKLQKRLMYQESIANKEEEESEGSLEEFALKYNLKHNNLFLRVYDSTINQMYNNRLIQAIQFGQKLVVDCGYFADMNKRENKNCAKQLTYMFSENRFSDDPFDLHLCNANLDSDLLKELNKFIPNMYELSFPLNVHECSYLDIFSKHELVYLTPHCREELIEYDHEAVYIVGGIVDKVNNEPLSLAKAKKEGLRMAKFPLDRYLQWGSGSGKSLTLNQVVSILNDVKLKNDWSYAFRHVPKRKLTDATFGSNIIKQSDDLSYDRPRRANKWIPSASIDLQNLSSQKTNRNKEKQKLVRIENIMNE